MQITTSTRYVQIGATTVEAYVDVVDGQDVIRTAVVRLPDGSGAIVQADNLDGTSWSIGLDGWVAGVSFPGIHAAVAAVTSRKSLRALRAFQAAQRRLATARVAVAQGVADVRLGQ